MSTASQLVWNCTALALVQELGTQAVPYCIGRVHALLKKGKRQETHAWIEITFATADIVAKLSTLEQAT